MTSSVTIAPEEPLTIQRQANSLLEVLDVCHRFLSNMEGADIIPPISQDVPTFSLTEAVAQSLTSAEQLRTRLSNLSERTGVV